MKFQNLYCISPRRHNFVAVIKTAAKTLFLIPVFLLNACIHGDEGDKVTYDTSVPVRMPIYQNGDFLQYNIIFGSKSGTEGNVTGSLYIEYSVSDLPELEAWTYTILKETTTLTFGSGVYANVRYISQNNDPLPDPSLETNTVISPNGTMYLHGINNLLSVPNNKYSWAGEASDDTFITPAVIQRPFHILDAKTLPGFSYRMAVDCTSTTCGSTWMQVSEEIQYTKINTEGYFYDGNKYQTAVFNTTGWNAIFELPHLTTALNENFSNAIVDYRMQCAADSAETLSTSAASYGTGGYEYLPGIGIVIMRFIACTYSNNGIRTGFTIQLADLEDARIGGVDLPDLVTALK